MDTRKATQDYRRQIWTELIRGRQGSGLTVTEYCAQNGIRPKQYYYWLHKLRTLACQTDESQAAAYMNKIIEKEIMRAPEQYLWIHRRFKTRPMGEASLYI